MAPARAVLVLLVLVLSPLRGCGAEVSEPGQLRGGQWVWGVAEPLPLSRRKRDDSGQELGATTTISSDKTEGSSAPSPAHGTTASLLLGTPVSPTADPSDDSPEPELLPTSVAPAPGNNASLLLRAPGFTTADPSDDSPEPEPLLSSAAPAPGNNASLEPPRPGFTTAKPEDETDSPHLSLAEGSVSPPVPRASTSPRRVFATPPTASPMDEMDSPDPDPLLSSAPPPATKANGVTTTADPTDETDPPDHDLLPGSPSAPPKSITTTPSWLMPHTEEATVAGGPDSSSSLVPTTTGYKKTKKSGAPPSPTLPAPWDTTPRDAAVPWEPGRVMSKCLLAILLLGLAAATFLVCSGVLGALLWRRARSGHRRLSPTEMVCISSLLPDAEAAPGPRPVPARRHKLLVPDGSAETDGDNLTLSSFLPEHS